MFKTYISLLRGINVSGHKKILMADLRALYQALGFQQLRSYLQSGNVIFKADVQATRTMAEMISKAIEQAYGFEVATVVIDPDDLQDLIASNPYQGQTQQDAKQPYVLLLEAPPAQDLVHQLEVPAKETAEFVIAGQRIFIYYPDGAGRSKLSTNFFERKLKVTGTMRNWKTITALSELVDAED